MEQCRPVAFTHNNIGLEMGPPSPGLLRMYDSIKVLTQANHRDRAGRQQRRERRLRCRRMSMQGATIVEVQITAMMVPMKGGIFEMIVA